MDSTLAKKLLMVAVETLEECKEIPAGHLYAAMMGTVTLDDYNVIEKLLIDIFAVKKTSFLLQWTDESQRHLDAMRQAVAAKRKQA